MEPPPLLKLLGGEPSIEVFHAFKATLISKFDASE